MNHIRRVTTGNDPCLNGAACVDLIGTFGCTCTEGYYGRICSNLGLPPRPSPCEDSATFSHVVDMGIDGATRFNCANIETRYDYWTDDTATNMTAREACPVATQSGCAPTYDDCCTLEPCVASWLSSNACRRVFCPRACREQPVPQRRRLYRQHWLLYVRVCSWFLRKDLRYSCAGQRPMPVRGRPKLPISTGNELRGHALSKWLPSSLHRQWHPRH